MITVKLKGRLGNHLFQYTICRIIAEKNGYEYSIPRKWLGQTLFDCPLGSNNIQKDNLKIYKEPDLQPLNLDILKISDNTILDGYWQSDLYYNGYEEQIKEWFRPNYPSKIIVPEDTCIIHLRMRDYYEKHKIPKQYFDKAKKIIKDKIDNQIKFWIVTDNIPVAKEYFPEDKIISKETTSMQQDFMLIYSAKYRIISPSTFAWWASWLNTSNETITIAPIKWMNYIKNKINREIPWRPNQYIQTKRFTFIN